jgi:hypothetical protein
VRSIHGRTTVPAEGELRELSLTKYELLLFSQVVALEEASPHAVAVALGAEDLGVAPLAVDVLVGAVATEHGIQGLLALLAGEAFLRKDR